MKQITIVIYGQVFHFQATAAEADRFAEAVGTHRANSL
jgi:hypothetical protein